MFATSFFWKALYSNSDTVMGVGVQEMLTYTIISALMSIFLTTKVEDRVIESVRQGSVAMDMMKPINLFGIYFAEDLGYLTSLLFQNAIPIIVIGSLFITIPRPASWYHFLAFLGSFLMSFFINWFLSAIFAMWAFSILNMNPLVQAKRHIIRLLSGSIVPIWFFPSWLAKILNCLPFVYIYQLPLDLYIGKGTPASMLPRLAIQFAWLMILAAAFAILQKRVLRKVMVQGG